MAKVKREPDTIWKLVNARCQQLADSVSAARVPFLTALTWSFVWAWALYSVDLGYLGTYRIRYANLYSQSAAEQPSVEFKKICAKVLEDLQSAPKGDLEAAHIQRCKDLVKQRFEWSDRAFLEGTQLTFPGGFGKLHVSDLGFAGQCGLVLILSWLFFAVRRENHSVRAIVDMDEASRKLGMWRPVAFTLKPQDETLSAEHVAYAYHSIAQRFVFLFSQHSRPLLLYTMLLLTIPALVASWNLYTDIRDLVRYPLEVSLLIKTIFEMFLLTVIWVLTYLIARHEIDTSVLLNGWYLASRDVWMDEWDERTLTKASAVKVNVLEQTAEIVSLPETNVAQQPRRRPRRSAGS